MTDSITIALSKGRILEETLPLLAEAGIELVDDVKKSRKLVFPTTDPNVRVLIIRATDVPTYVQYGGADLGGEALGDGGGGHEVSLPFGMVSDAAVLPDRLCVGMTRA